MSRLWKQLRESKDLSAVANVGQVAIWLVGGSGAALAALAALPSGVPVVLGVSGGVLAIAAAAVLLSNRRRRVRRSADWNPDLWIYERYGHVTVHSPERIDYENRVKVRVLADHVSCLYWRVGWTGRGTFEVEVFNPGFKHALEKIPLHFRRLRIDFDYPRMKGEELDISFQMRTFGTTEPQEPFYALANRESRIPQKAHIKVRFLDGVPTKSVLTEIYADDNATRPIKPARRVELDRHGAMEWPIHPQAGRRYCVRWNYE